jgi:O-antigen/teichoic acid export membrane protein
VAEPEAELAPAMAPAVVSRDRRLLRRAVLINFAGLLGKGLWPIFLWLVASWYGAATLGRFTLLQAPLELALALCSTGFVDGIYRNVARLPGDPLGPLGYASIRLALRHVVALGTALFALAALAGGAFVSLVWHRPELHLPLAVMAAAVPIGGATSILVATSTAMMRNEGEAMIKGALVPGLTLALCASPSARAAGVEGLAWAYLLAQLAGLLAAVLLFTRFASLRELLLPREEAKALEASGASGASGRLDARAQRRFGLLQGLNLMLWMSVYSIDTLLLGAFLGDADVARYRAGSELARLLQYARTQVSSAFVPLASRYLLRGEREPLQALLSAVAGTLASGALLIAGVLSHLAPPILQAILGQPAHDSYAFVSLLLLGHVVVAAFALAGNTMILAGHQRQILINSATMTVVNLVLGLLLIPRFGIAGAATATLGAMTVAMLGQTFRMRVSLALSLPLRTFAVVAALAAAAYGLSLLIALAFPAAWPRALVGAASFAALFGAALLSLRRRSP